jgi:hypothetical protein
MMVLPMLWPLNDVAVICMWRGQHRDQIAWPLAENQKSSDDFAVAAPRRTDRAENRYGGAADVRRAADLFWEAARRRLGHRFGT